MIWLLLFCIWLVECLTFHKSMTFDSPFISKSKVDSPKTNENMQSTSFTLQNFFPGMTVNIFRWLHWVALEFNYKLSVPRLKYSYGCLCYVSMCCFLSPCHARSNKMLMFANLKKFYSQCLISVFIFIIGTSSIFVGWIAWRSKPCEK